MANQFAGIVPRYLIEAVAILVLFYRFIVKDNLLHRQFG